MDDRYGYSLGVFDGSDLEKNLNMDIEERMRESLKNEEKREMLSLVLKSYGFEREIDDEMIEVFISLYKKVLEAFEELGEILKNMEKEVRGKWQTYQHYQHTR